MPPCLNGRNGLKTPRTNLLDGRGNIMSGGSLNYFYCMLQEHAGDFGDKELDELVKDLAELFHDREWYLSADTGIGDWNEARDEFKKKWFTKHGRQKRIEQYLAEIREEVMKSFGIGDEYCKNCVHWKPETKDGRYGRCDFVSGCLMHRSEHCERWLEEQ